MKYIKYLLVTMISFVVFISGVEAASVSIKSSYTAITKGNSVKITATVSSDSPIVSIEGTLLCKGAGVNSGVDMEFDDVSNKLYKKSYSTTVKATSTGTITCTVSGARLTSMASDSWQKISNKSISINVKEPVYIPPKEYSSNNNLKSLGIKGYSISPSFSKDVKEYTVEVPNGTKNVLVEATKEDDTATIKGIGKISVVEGANKIKIKVTAENGNINTYVINVTVKELDPILVTIEDIEYNIIRKEGVLKAPDNYEKTSIKIGEQDVLCYKNIVTGNTLIGLKDSSGDSKFYSYNEEKNEYTPYNGYKMGGVSLNILDMPSDEIPVGYSKVSFEYNEDKIDGYQFINTNVTYAADNTVQGNDFYLIYAINEMSGDKGLYVYDKLEGTVQRYNNNLFMSYQNKIDSYMLYLLIMLVILAITIITFILILMKKKKHKSKFA